MESSVHHEEGGEWFRYGREEAKKPRAKRNIKVVTRMNEEEEEGERERVSRCRISRRKRLLQRRTFSLQRRLKFWYITNLQF